MNYNEMVNIFVFGDYAAIAANMPNRRFCVPWILCAECHLLHLKLEF